MAGVRRWETGNAGPASPATREERRLVPAGATAGAGDVRTQAQGAVTDILAGCKDRYIADDSDTYPIPH